MKKILILNGSISEIPIIQKAKEMGFYVITTGNAPELPGHRYADEYILADYSDKQEILKMVQDHHIDGIISCANDFGVLTASYVADHMGWPGHDTYENSVLMHHKDQFKQYCFEHHIPSPRSHSFTDRGQAIEYCHQCEYPIIVKASDMTGGKGILRADNVEQSILAVDNAFKSSRNKHIVIEPYLIGTQQSIVVFLINQRIVMTSCSNIYCLRNPYLVQSETYPAENFDLVRRELHQIIHDMADDLHLADGIFSFQYIVHSGRPYIIEMMRRCFGNEALLLADTLTGYPWEEAYIRASLGMDCSKLKAAKPKAKFCGHHGIMAECNGILDGYSIDPSIEPHIFKKTELLQPGDRIDNYMNDRIAHIYYMYDSMEEMNQEVIRYNDLIKIRLR